ncbi:hypothetical protein [Microvirga roseola]|uniref:hypothetical protein n=1 Tax=Microvirga roseola TaxID=2883126 RepID=UPI001E3C1883|nr:hypothetical protein [Microvirga roseola]
MRSGLAYGARRAAAALLLIAAAVSPLAAQGLDAFGDPDERQRQLEPPLPLPEGSIGTVKPPTDETPVRRVDRIRDVFQAIRACWRPPRNGGFSGQEVTIRLSFKRSGEVLGQPRITYYNPGSQPEMREAFTRSVRETFERCTPLPFTEGLGRAIAGRPFIFRFSDTRPM